MLKYEHMESGNTATIDGLEVEGLNSDLENIDRARRACDMLGGALGAMLQPESRRLESINKVRNSWGFQSGVVAMLELISHTLAEAEENMTGIIDGAVKSQTANSIRIEPVG